MLIIANWKENKTLDEATAWLDEFQRSVDATSLDNNVVVLAPAFPLISVLRDALARYPALKKVCLSAQDVSRFENGAYTGEVAAKQLKGLVDYVIVGHSERRQHFGETYEDVNRKIEWCVKYNLTPVVCVSDLSQVKALQLPASSPPFPVIIAYEPPFAIGSGHPDDPAHDEEIALAIREILGENTKVLYGGSLNVINVRGFAEQPHIEGFLVGTASLAVKTFVEIVEVVGGERLQVPEVRRPRGSIF